MWSGRSSINSEQSSTMAAGEGEDSMRLCPTPPCPPLVRGSSRKNISEVMFDVGYTDTKAFRTIFKKVTGLTPIEYRNRYNKQAVAI